MAEWFILYMKKPSKRVPIDPDKALRNLGARIKDLRQKQGYSSSEQFAFEHEIARTQFSRYENGEDLRFSSLVKVINAFGISIDEFFSEGFE